MKYEYLGFLDFNEFTIIATLLNALILFFVFKRFLFDKVNAILDERNKEVVKSYEDADSALANAKSIEVEYTEKLASAKEESAEIVKNATKKATVRYDEIVSEAKDDARGIVDKANADIEKEKKRAVNQIKDEISDIAMSIAEKVVVKELDAKSHEKLIEEFINEIGDAT